MALYDDLGIDEGMCLYLPDGEQREYDTSLAYAPLPADLCAFATSIARDVGYPEFSPDAAIVNYYEENDMLGGHVDDSERSLADPIVSIR